MTSSYDNV
uniref:Uncharacterized protein n=1 Tax=Anguilla anguilla TaxID=7936 RepID=A0A0E9Q9J1_ANGAN